MSRLKISSAAFWFEAFFHVKLIGAVRKRWNAAKLAHGLSFPPARERLGCIRNREGGWCVVDRKEREKEGNAATGCLAGLFYVWILYRGGLMGQTDHLSR